MQAGAIVTFAPYSTTEAAYKTLQNCLAKERNTNIDYILYQTYGANDADLAQKLKDIQSCKICVRGNSYRQECTSHN